MGAMSAEERDIAGALPVGTGSVEMWGALR